MVAATQMGLCGYGVQRSFAPPAPQVTWTLVLNYDPSWIGNSQNSVAVTGFLMSNGAAPIMPGLPPGTK